MKIMYVACNPRDSDELMLEYELSDLQDRFAAASGEPVTVVALPRLPFERLPIELARHQPDILHISAHGEGDNLALANADGDLVALSAEALLAFLMIERSPELVYLNACNSEAIADSLSKHVKFAVGTTAPITNRTARAAAVVFYDAILR